MIEVATGHNNTAGLGALNPQPEYSGRRYLQTRFTAEEVVKDGLYVELRYRWLDPVDYAALRAQLGLSSADAAAITIAIPEEADLTSNDNFNANVTVGEATAYFPVVRNVVFIVRNMVAI